ncbi:uncharacterized protein LOC129759175, partial [Uranotaenia lowii]|uniref:uncharacterized protein LOC129759175 n=1 Tax=Uranotaenia lowii TaxID=190385 RepID=UPI002478EECF
AYQNTRHVLFESTAEKCSLEGELTPTEKGGFERRRKLRASEKRKTRGSHRRPSFIIASIPATFAGEKVAINYSTPSVVLATTACLFSVIARTWSQHKRWKLATQHHRSDFRFYGARRRGSYFGGQPFNITCSSSCKFLAAFVGGKVARDNIPTSTASTDLLRSQWEHQRWCSATQHHLLDSAIAVHTVVISHSTSSTAPAAISHCTCSAAISCGIGPHIIVSSFDCTFRLHLQCRINCGIGPFIIYGTARLHRGRRNNGTHQ